MQRLGIQWREWPERASELARRFPFECAVTLILSVYFAFNLTPSAYAHVLRILGVSDTGLVFGEPSGLRIDEFAVWTPYLQSVVRNGFQRFNETSPYHEDFRNFNALPLLDWALVFKPQYWGFFLLPPARAFSLYHTLLIGSCLIGWSLVFRRWGFPALWAAAASLLILFSGHTQFSWTTWGSLPALLPLLILTFSSSMRPWLKFPLLVWLITTWLLSHLYPPIIISLGLAAVFLVVAFTPKVAFDWRNIAAVAAAFVVSVLVVRLYLDGVFEIMSNTVYPGQRSVSGGTLPWAESVAQFFPFLPTRKDADIFGINAYEAATGSSYLPLLTLIFLDWRNVIHPTAEVRKYGWTIFVLLAGLALFGAWMFLPIPNSVGALLMFDKILPQRMMGATGLLLLALSMVLLKTAGVRMSLVRLLLLTAAVVMVWFAWKSGPSWSLRAALTNNGYWDLLILPAFFLAGAVLFFRRDWLAPAIIVACAATNIVGFGWINPLQAAGPIFAEVRSANIEALETLQKRNAQNRLVIPAVPTLGAALNGLGFRSINHTLIAPQLAFFRPYFPDLPQGRFNWLFNRYSAIELQQIDTPALIGLSVATPIEPFLDPREKAEMQLPVSWQSEGPTSTGPAGHVDEVEIIGDNKVRLRGWAALDPADAGNKLVIVSPEPGEIVDAKMLFRFDVVNVVGDPDLLRSGFDIVLSAPDLEGRLDTLAVFSVSRRYGVHRLQMGMPSG
jgi:hypothetical protein